MCAIVDVFIDMMLCTSITKWHHVAMWLVTNTWYKNNMCPILLARPSHFWVCENRTKKKKSTLFLALQKEMTKNEKYTLHCTLHPCTSRALHFFFFYGYDLRKLKLHAAEFWLGCETVWKTTLYFTMLLRCGCCTAIGFLISQMQPCKHIFVYLFVYLFIYCQMNSVSFPDLFIN